MVRILTSEEIAEAKKSTPYLGRDNLHEHDDCIRIAYQWLDAQEKTKGQLKRSLAIKHIVEKWGQRYVSSSDVEVAAHMHPDITGRYPRFNISSRLTRPSKIRLEHIGEAGAHPRYGERQSTLRYARDEQLHDAT
ncbi:hypothetical protein [Kaistia defluvii]|uniref:Integrase n=1 Tax=Kaistia defluvii TaxID=410841 RepID=A0ABV2R1D5_9HYPH